MPPVGVIDGSTGLNRRTLLVDELQSSPPGCLVCQITAAGVGLTLTACANPLFVESDWTAQLMSQAEDRHHRPGQDRGVTLTALCATGSLDEHVVKVRNRRRTGPSPGGRRPLGAGDAGRRHDNKRGRAVERLAEVAHRVRRARHRSRRGRRAA